MKKILVGIIILLMIGGCAETSQIRGVVIPHHLLVKGHIEEFYAEIADPSIKRIIILSPNHFEYGLNDIQSTNREYDEEESFEVPKLDIEFINDLEKKTPLVIEPRFFREEHGVFVHFSFILKYFPEAKIVPIIFKKDSLKLHLDVLVDEIEKMGLEDTLILASIDFSHYVEEEIAIKNDQRTLKWLEEWASGRENEDSLNTIRFLSMSLDMKNRDAVAIDSPESLYVFTKLLKKPKFRFWKRTSTFTEKGVNDPDLSTSHLYLSVY